MTDTSTLNFEQFILPPNVVSRVDVSRLMNELETIDNAMTSGEVRAKTDGAQVVIPSPSNQLAAFLEANHLELTNSAQRSALVEQVRRLKDTVPIIHMTFAVEADPESLAQLAAWLRESIHPQAVIAVGLQPSLVAGVSVRTPNHIHDLSLRGKLDGSHDLLVKEMEALRVGR